jgi:hypothetical protein
MIPGSEKKVTFLRQHDLDQVPGVETQHRFLSADLHRLPQSTNAYCTGDEDRITLLNGLSTFRKQVGAAASL